MGALGDLHLNFTVAAIHLVGVADAQSVGVVPAERTVVCHEINLLYRPRDGP